MKRIATIIGLLLLSTAVIAQETLCPTLERAAVSEARIWCSELSDGLACLGNSGVQADLLSDVSFNTVGDIAPLTDVTQITTRTEENRYGIVLIHTTGYAPDNWAAQDVTLAVLGDVTLANTGNEGINLQTITTPITSAEGANIRSGPTTDYRVLTPLFEGDLVKLTGRLTDDSAYRVQLPDGQTGWIAASAVDAEVSALPTVALEDSAPEHIYAPYTAFSLQTGIDDADCTDAWQSGVLMQSPVDSPVRFLVNDVALTLSGTAFLQADADRILVHALEGQVTYQGEIVAEGYTLAIFPDSSRIFAYDVATYAPLPTEILPRYAYIGVDLTTLITPAPQINRSPIADVLVDYPCVITTGEGGANFRAGPSSEFPIRGVLGFRETVNPISRASGPDGLVWYEIAQNVWVTSQVVVTGGDCIGLPQAERIPALQATPEN